VASGWAPYTTGRWAWVAPWGWTWVDDAPWGFAPFHYGRWVYVGASWCWSPGTYVRRPVYAPALVAWIGGPRLSVGITVGGGPAIGWVPLAPREVYVPTYRVSPGYVRNVNVTHVTNITNITTIINNPQQAVSDRDYSNRKFPHAVTVVSANTLTSRQPVAAAAAQWRSSPAVRELGNEPPRGNFVAAPTVAAPPPAQRRPEAPAVRPTPAPAGGLSQAIRERGPGFKRNGDQPDALRQAPEGRPAQPQPQAQPMQPAQPQARPAEQQPQGQPQTRPAPVTPPTPVAPPAVRQERMPPTSPAMRPVQPVQPAQPAQPAQAPTQPMQRPAPAQPAQPAQPPAPVQRPVATPVPAVNPGALMRGNGQQPGRADRPEAVARPQQAEPQRAPEQRRERDDRPGAVRER
jgi:hypothetical protein